MTTRHVGNYSSALKKSLLRFVPKSVAASVGTRLAASRGQGLRQIFPEGEIWIHQTDFGYFAYPHPYVRLDLQHFEEITRRNFFWGYTPKPGDVVMDVGAGVGEDVLTFSKAVGSRGKVICIEAHPKTYACLEALVRYNRLENVITVQQAVTKPFQAEATIDDSDDYLSNRLGNTGGIPVPATTIDAIRRQLGLGRVNFLKMNIEGAERLAIRGMKETIEETETLCICCHDFLAKENGDESCRTKSVVRDFLQGGGLKVVERSEAGCPAYINDQIWAFNPVFVSTDRVVA